MKIIISKSEILSRFNLPIGVEIEVVEDFLVIDTEKSLNGYFKITDDGKLKTSELLAKCKEKFDCWSYWNDKELDKNFPLPKKTTTRYFKKTVEPDKETLGKSDDEIDPDGTKGCTLREYMLMCLAYFEETGGHLDEKGWTICTGSRLQGGGVAYGYWDPIFRRVYFYWLDPQRSYPCFGARLWQFPL